jgi:hypothetical protein
MWGSLPAYFIPEILFVVPVSGLNFQGIYPRRDLQIVQNCLHSHKNDQVNHARKRIQPPENTDSLNLVASILNISLNLVARQS